MLDKEKIFQILLLILSGFVAWIFNTVETIKDRQSDYYQRLSAQEALMLESRERINRIVDRVIAQTDEQTKINKENANKNAFISQFDIRIKNLEKRIE